MVLQRSKGEDELTGRPSDYNTDIASVLCEQIVEGKSLRSICRADDMPAIATVFKWLNAHPPFVEQYTRAREAQADTLADELLDIADDKRADVNRSRLMVDARKWIASKLKPKKYGEKIETTHRGDAAHPVYVTATDAKL
jgi:hypothetical protein